MHCLAVLTIASFTYSFLIRKKASAGSYFLDA
jgi:hypothetical protein